MKWRKATIHDAALAVPVVNHAYRGFDGWTSEGSLIEGTRITEVEFVQFINQHDPSTGVTILFFDEQGNELVGTICIERHDTAAHLGMISVDPRRQNSGIGREILSVAEKYVKDSWGGVNVLQMSVISQRSELVDWYLRRGFSRTSKTLAFPYDDATIGKPLRQDLFFVVLEKSVS